MLTNIRIRLADPRSQQPSERTLLLLLSTQVQNFATEANLSGRHWAVDETFLPVVAGVNDYEISEASFGKPLEIYSYYPSDPGHITYPVNLIDLGDVHFDWGLPENVASGFNTGSPHTAIRIAFYRKQGVLHARVLPTPTTSATYKVLYQIGVYGETVPLDETPFLPEHHSLIELRTAISALPHSEWFDNDDDRNRRRREELALSMAPDSERLERNFRSYITSITGKGGMSIRYEPVPYG